MKYTEKKPSIDAFQYGIDPEPNWFSALVSNGKVNKISPDVCHIIQGEEMGIKTKKKEKENEDDPDEIVDVITGPHPIFSHVEKGDFVLQKTLNKVVTIEVLPESEFKEIYE